MSTPTQYRRVMQALRDRLRAQQVQGGTLAAAEEIRIGLHAEDAAWKACGVYLLPDKDLVDDIETTAWQHTLRLKVIASSRIESWTGDTDDEDPGTLRLMDLVGGILDLVTNNRSLTNDAYLGLGSEVDFLVARGQDETYYYRAEVPVTITFTM